MNGIFERIDAALEKMAWQGLEVRAIYLDPADNAQWVKASTEYWRKVLGSTAIFHCTTWRDHILKQGSRSAIYSTHGVAIAIPKKLSPKVREAA